MKPITFTLALLFLISASQCRKASPLGCATFALDIQDEAEAWSNAASAYGDDPTPENCRKYQSTGQAYLDALKRYNGCAFTPANEIEWNQMIAEAEQDLKDLNC